MKESQVPRVSIIVPLYNEEEVFSYLESRLKEVLDAVEFDVECILIDDGSSDDTRTLMSGLASADSRFKALILSKNHGHQLAISAGMAYAQATDAIMVIDGDLQDPPELLSEWYRMIASHECDVVYGVRKMRDDEGWFKKYTSLLFYRLLNKLTSEPIPLDSGDFCMMSRRVVDILTHMPERYRFIRGMRALIGFNQIAYPYEREKRVAGETKYSLKKMLRLAMDAVYGFSETPYKIMMGVGFSMIFLSVLYFLFSIVKAILFDTVVSGFLGLLLVIIIIGGINLIGLGVLGGYMIRNFFQMKGRPLFIVDQLVTNEGVQYENQYRKKVD